MAEQISVLCPKCERPLIRTGYHTVELEVCEPCHSVLLPHPRLPGLLEKLSAEIGSAVDLDMPLEAVPDRGAGVSCPKCGQEMNHYGYLGGHWVMMDGCEPCGVLWLNHDALGLMAVMFARSQRRAEKFRREAYEPTPLTDHIRANSLGKLVAHHILR